MKSFADRNFFLLFEEIVRRDHQSRACDTWSAAGVDWRHGRHSFESDRFGFANETYEATRAGKKGWVLLVVKEHWWAGKRGDPVKTVQWAKPLAGSRAAIFAWLKERQREFGF
jgi:hypothetical protein